MSFLNELRTALRKRAAFNRTLGELRNLTGAEMRDLNISAYDIRSIAREAVYGA